MNIFSVVTIIVICVLAEAFFSGSEIGVVSADQIKLRHDAAKGSKGAELALKMLKNPEWLLSTTLIGTNLATVANTTVTTALMIDLFGAQFSWLAIVLVAPLIWMFGEIIPKTIFQQRADALTPWIIFPLRFASFVFSPLLVVFTLFARLLAVIFGRSNQNPFALREQILTMLNMPDEEGDLHPVEKDMIQRIFTFSETKVYEIMVPLIDVAAIEKKADCAEAVRSASECAHIRLPVYDEQVNKIIGVINVLELLSVDETKPISPFIRPAKYVPTSKNISELLFDLRQDVDTVAIAVDEFGGAVGLVTIEDIMEEVVQEMEDEYDGGKKSVQWVRKISGREYIVSARIEIDTLEQELDIKLTKGKYATLAGYLLEKTGEIPAPKTVIKSKNITFIIEQSTPQAVQEVRIKW